MLITYFIQNDKKKKKKNATEKKKNIAVYEVDGEDITVKNLIGMFFFVFVFSFSRRLKNELPPQNDFRSLRRIFIFDVKYS